MTSRLFLGLALMASAAAAADVRSCRAAFDGKELTIANAHLERRWRVANGLLYATSFRDIDAGVEWLSGASPQPAPYPAAAVGAEPRAVTFTQKTGRFSAVEAESLVAELTAAGAMTLVYRFQVFPDARGISIRLTSIGSGRQAGRVDGQTNAPTGVETDRPNQPRETKFLADALELFDLAPQHMKLIQVRLADQTDAHNELVFEDEWLLHTAERLRLTGNLFILENTLSGAGLILLKEAPLPHARPVKAAADFAYEPQFRRAAFLGEGYRFVTLAYSGGRAGRIATLQNYQRQLRVYDPKRDGMFLSNTWGDRSRDSRITEEFLTKEVEAGARLGVDTIQIDDGWQQGKTSNSVRAGGVWQGFWAADPNFWNFDAQRFPRGLAPVVKLAASKGMGFGLWFGPDSANDFANWRKDADKIIELHHTLGINYIKIDGVKAPTRASEENLRRFFDAVLDGSNGRVTFDLDVTAEIRPGYFGMINVGPLFVENRYTDWHRYWPHQTLRNLWKLAQYVDPLRLRMEFLNNARNAQAYANDPLAPATYSPACLFATVMFANPLGWFEVSNLPASYFEELRPLIARWKEERPKLFGGAITPIGEAPDGVAWTGFVSAADGGSRGYALLFRELNAAAEWQCDVPMFRSREYAATVLGGTGNASVQNGRLRARIPDTRQFVWVKLEAK